MKAIIEITIENCEHIMDWLSILNFICNLHYLLTSSSSTPKKVYLQNKSILSSEISVSILEKCLISPTLNPKADFLKYILAVMTVSKE